ncbi:MAG: hypothetical protein IT373_29370 [Polyangiaceae bacterium]|nr:hypothetical protein [Polyangiaceae bacterium]
MMPRSWLVLGLTVVSAFGCAAGSNTGEDPGSGNASAAGGTTTTASGGAGGTVLTGGSGGSGGDGCLEGETCGDGLDNDCNGSVDDGCPCTEGQTQDCYAGPSPSAGVGNCTMGVQSCENKGEFPVWGLCNGSVLPAPEVCDQAQADEDCDGVGNDGCACAIGSAPVPCGTDVGECVAGTQECIDGQYGPCVGALNGYPETCNGLDDDCDGVVDGLTQSCGQSVGACQAGTSTCTAGQWGACTGGVGPSQEVCNDIDDDCDGSVDESLTQACGSNAGICTQGTQTCAAGQWGVCIGGVSPGVESCNLLDDDCDGQADEGCNCVNGQIQPCGTDVGACVAGTQTCSGGAWGSCAGAVGPTTETCNNIDDDCDGSTDEGLTQGCGSDVGACVAGTQTCSAGVWSACAGSVGPTGESCNNADDDCDGLTDELLTQVCGVTDVGACSLGTLTCSGGSWGSCVGAINPVTEICANGKDDDCDGATDEAADCPDLPPVCACPATPIQTQPLATLNLSASCSDPDGGTMSYLWEVTSAPAGSASQPALPNSAATTFFVDLAGSYTLTLWATDDEGHTVSCVVVIESVPQQDLHIELVWDEAWGDADLHLVQAGIGPAGYWYTSDADCFFGNTAGAWPPNGPAGNSSLDIDDTDGYGPENINILTSPQAGTYNVGVAYYCQHSLQRPGQPPIDPGDGPTTATVNVYCGGVLVKTWANITLDRTGRFVHVGTVTWPSCATATVSNNTWTALVQPDAYPSPLHCTLPCSNNSNCGGGEVCSAGTCVLAP